MSVDANIITASPMSVNNGTSSGKKKHESANHLLQFKLPPRQQHPAFTGAGSSGSGRKSRVSISNYQPFDKKRFVHANYRFVVSDRYPDQHNHVVDPDIIVPWDRVEQVLITSSAEENCPICLSNHVAPQVAQCGHVFCSSCILHYISLGEKNWKSCPICHERLSAKELKSALILSVTDYSKFEKPDRSSMSAEDLFLQEAYNQLPTEKTNECILMRLMQRSSGSTTILPRNRYSRWAMNDLPRLDGNNQDLLSYSKVLLASPSYIKENIIQPQLSQLYQATVDAKALGDTEELVYIDMAISRCKEKLESLTVTEATTRRSSGSINAHLNRPLLSSRNSKNDLNDFSSLPASEVPVAAFSDATSEDESLISTSSTDSQSISLPLSPGLDPQSNTAGSVLTESNGAGFLNTSGKAASISNDGMLYFYQAIDGQHIFLHPLEIKILKSEYGDYHNFPEEICVKISQLAESTLTEDARKRYKYVAHLPLSCDISFVEVDWNDKRNVCRKTVAKDDAVAVATSPSLFSADHPLSKKLSLEKLVHNASIKLWSHELHIRKHKREKKKKLEEKEQARIRRDSFSKSTESTADTQQLALRRSPETIENEPELFDFEDETKWIPLGGSSNNPPRSSKSDSPPTSQTPPSPRLTPATNSTPVKASWPSYAEKALGVLSPPANNNDDDSRKKGKKKQQILLFTNTSSRRA